MIEYRHKSSRNPESNLKDTGDLLPCIYQMDIGHECFFKRGFLVFCFTFWKNVYFRNYALHKKSEAFETNSYYCILVEIP